MKCNSIDFITIGCGRSETNYVADSSNATGIKCVNENVFLVLTD